jgi:hypothetical protein
LTAKIEQMRATTLLSLLLTVFAEARAQKPFDKSGCLIYTLGKDTTAIGNFELKGYEFAMTVADLTDSVTVSKLKGTFFPNGELRTAEGSTYKPGPGGESQLVYTYKLRYDSNATFIEVGRNNAVITRKYPVKIMVANSLGGYTLVYMPALLVNFALRAKGDSLSSHHIVFNSARNFTIRRIGERDFSAGSPVMGFFTLHLDKNGELRTVDGIGTSWNITGTVGPPVDMDSVIAAQVKNDRMRPHRPIANKLDSVTATIGGTMVRIRYSRPSARGRTIFGGVVPYDRFWRTGADAATKLTISRPIYFDGKALPAGEYSIFTMPSKHGWTMMFNKQADIWGTEYKAENDVLRIPMSVEDIPDLVETLTIDVVPVAGGGKMEVSWERLKASVRFTTSGH